MTDDKHDLFETLTVVVICLMFITLALSAKRIADALDRAYPVQEEGK